MYKRHYVYIHKKADSQEVFYVGIGTRSAPEVINGYANRAHHKGRRTELYKRTIQKHGRIVELVFESDDYNLVKEIEKNLILKHGKKFNNSGTLVNFTDGGEGTTGWKPSDEWKSKMKTIINEGYSSGSRKTSAKKLYQYSISGEFIKEWSSRTDAATYLNVSVSAIKLKYSWSVGFQWKNEYLGNTIPSTTIKRQLICHALR